MMQSGIASQQAPAKPRIPPLVIGGGTVCVILATCVICVAIGLVASAVGRAVSADDIPGTYYGASFGQAEFLVIRADGSFSETIINDMGETYRGTGRWRSEGRGRNVVVVLDRAVIRPQISLNSPLIEEQRLKIHKGVRGSRTLIMERGDPDGIVNLRAD